MPEEQEPAVTQLLLTEYQSIKEEQRTRIGFRDNLLYVTLAAVVAVVATTLQAKQAGFLLAMPPVSMVLGWTYLVNDEKISAIGRYVRTELAPRLATLSGAADTPVFGWETAHRSDQRRSLRKVIQCIIDLTAFCVVPSAAVCVFWGSSAAAGPLIALSVVEVLATAGLATQFLLYASSPTVPRPQEEPHA